MLVVDEGIAIPLSEFRFEFSRSGGPGGQNVNKVHSRAVLRWKPGESQGLPEPVKARLLASLASRLTAVGELLVGSQRSRDQGRNVEDCLDKVRALIRAAARPPKPRRPTRPTRASRARRAEAKAHRSATKKLRRRPQPE
jgi:ribosome-associated protein